MSDKGVVRIVDTALLSKEVIDTIVHIYELSISVRLYKSYPVEQAHELVKRRLSEAIEPYMKVSKGGMLDYVDEEYVYTAKIYLPYVKDRVVCDLEAHNRSLAVKCAEKRAESRKISKAILAWKKLPWYKRCFKRSLCI